MEQILPITIYPFAIIDNTLRVNMNLSAIDAVEKISSIIEDVKHVEGTLVTIWHNDTLSNKGIWKGWCSVYENMIKLIK